jgi:hypothetical protein
MCFRVVVLLLSMLVCTSAYASPVKIIVVNDSASTEIAAIDQKIAALQVKRSQARLNRDMANRNADRLLTQDWLGYRRQLALSAQYDRELEQIDAKIAELNKQKQQLLK